MSGKLWLRYNYITLNNLRKHKIGFIQSIKVRVFWFVGKYYKVHYKCDIILNFKIPQCIKIDGSKHLIYSC